MKCKKCIDFDGMLIPVGIANCLSCGEQDELFEPYDEVEILDCKPNSVSDNDIVPTEDSQNKNGKIIQGVGGEALP